MFMHVYNELMRQISEAGAQDIVEILSDDSTGITTGRKRNGLERRARGGHVSHVDDDDDPATTYVQDILPALYQSPDVVTFDGRMTTDGKNEVKWHIRLGEKYEERGGRYYRFPNHLCPMRREIVLQVPFPNKTQGEDYERALQIHQLGLLKTEVVIPKELYHYKFRTKK